MKFTIQIHSDSELITYEAIALAFTLASFDHSVQLCFGGASSAVLMDNKSRLYGMLQSLELYDLPKAVHTFSADVFAQFDEPIRDCFVGSADLPDNKPPALADTILSF